VVAQVVHLMVALLEQVVLVAAGMEDHLPQQTELLEHQTQVVVPVVVEF
jgi:hypothetical protein